MSQPLFTQSTSNTCRKRLNNLEKRAIRALCLHESPDNGDYNSEHHRWSRSKSCRMVDHCVCFLKGEMMPLKPGETAHCAESPRWDLGLWQLCCQVGHLSNTLWFRPYSFYFSDSTHRSLLLPCFLFQKLRKVLSEPQLVVLHCASLIDR